MTRCLGRICSVVVEAAMLAAGGMALGWYVIAVIIGSLDPSIAADTRGPRIPQRQ
jgi:hypothetical protein